MRDGLSTMTGSAAAAASASPYAAVGIQRTHQIDFTRSGIGRNVRCEIAHRPARFDDARPPEHGDQHGAEQRELDDARADRR